MSAVVEDLLAVNARQAVLSRREWYPAPGRPLRVSAAGLAAGTALPDALAPAGLALFEVTEPLDTARFIEVASVLGVPEPETERSLMHRVEQGVVLNLRPDARAEPVTEHSQPFTDSPLTFHTEGSRRPLGTSPSYLLFSCVRAPEPDQGAQTLLRSVPDVLAGVSGRSRAILEQTVLTPESCDASVICELDGRVRLNFRDPAPAPFTWRSPFSDRQVTRALAELLRLVYDDSAVAGIRWRDGQLAVIDNSRWLHARSAGHGGDRHLRRIRIGAGGRGRS